jgi:hypothetical protein
MRIFTLFIAIMLSMNAYSAKALKVKGDVQYQRNNDGVWIVLKRGQKLSAMDEIKTGKDASAEIEVVKGFEVKLGANTQVGINDIGTDEATGIFPSVMVFLGNVYTKVKGSLVKKSEVQTATSILGVRGTEFITDVSTNGLTSVFMDNGTIELATQEKKNAEIQKVSAGQYAVVDYDFKISVYKTKKEFNDALNKLADENKANPLKLQNMMLKILESIYEEASDLKKKYDDNNKKVIKLREDIQTKMIEGKKDEAVKLTDQVYTMSFDQHNFRRKLGHLKFRSKAVRNFVAVGVNKNVDSRLDEIAKLTTVE